MKSRERSGKMKKRRRETRARGEGREQLKEADEQEKGEARWRSCFSRTAVPSDRSDRVHLCELVCHLVVYCSTNEV